MNLTLTINEPQSPGPEMRKNIRNRSKICVRTMALLFVSGCCISKKKVSNLLLKDRMY